ncbi:hypothetical protein IMCC3317_06570 [Kordia antarctica]|uniref:Type II secretion system protein GspG C-terminal domain-containing protein n=1 Tax=Kordia antarctica TaxID=1218801 RepID=A0A7L4ZFU0_9FLAO|nr:type II secretion system protein GspG [Kordia antarctica]QHI35311.1 hypothetical protein IMCC3317_06570 [Kordia antarctica]
MEEFIRFRKRVSYVSMSVFALITILFFSSYTAMKKERRTNGRLFSSALLLAYEKNDTGEYPFDLNCFSTHNRFDKEYITTDSWGNTFFYESFDNGKDYTLFSVGKDGIPFTEDDIHTEKLNRSNCY